MQHQASLRDDFPLDRILEPTQLGELIGVSQQVHLSLRSDCICISEQIFMSYAESEIARRKAEFR
jgi:hypothetical protein